MLLGYNTSGLQNHRLDEALRLLADSGFAAVALTPDVGHLDPFRCSAREIEELAGLLSRLQLQPVIETGARFLLDPAHKHEPTLMTADAAGRERRLDFYRRTAAIGRDLGAQVLSFWAGIDHQPGPDSASRLDSGVAAAVAAVRESGLTPALEPEPGMAVETVQQFTELVARLGSEAPALTLDIGHLYVVWEGSPADVIARCGSQIAQGHLEDMRRGEHVHLVPGQGEVDFDAVLGALAGTGYAGPVCFELSRSSHEAPRAVAACVDVWRRWRSGR
ncbi:MAG: sugar phosphate isomerase/epimerase family protein [Planctomycetota bacterium]|nr:sugar phosphate isomerase/epimerase family protein [Planctomycetota bacterium]